MIQRIPQSIWLLIAVLLGISLGIGLGQDQWNFFGVIFGWYYFFLGITQLLLGLYPYGQLQVQWFAWQLSWIYPLALLAYAVCAFWTIRSPRSTHNGLTVTVVGAFVSTLASIPSAIVTMSINGHDNFFSALFYYAPALLMHIPILINLFISAMLGWLIAMGLTRLGRGDKAKGLGKQDQETMDGDLKWWGDR